MPHNILKILFVVKLSNYAQKLNALLEATEGLWDTPGQYSYKLTERGEVAYGIIKSRNIEIKDKREPDEKETPGSFLKSLKEKISRRFL